MAVARLAGYHVLYEVDTSTSGQRITRWESLTVARPFTASDLTYDTRPADSTPPVNGYVSDEKALAAVDKTGTHIVAGRQPGVPAGDQDLATQLPELLHRNLAADTASDMTVAGRACRVYRFFEPPSGPIKPLADAGDHDDVCLDRDGIVLSEAWTYRSQLVYERRALEVSPTATPLPPLADEARAVTAPSAPTSSSPAPSLVADPSPRSFLAAPPTPPGFHPLGSFDFTLPRPQAPGAPQAASVVWVFGRGTEVVTVEAGSQADGAVPWQASDTATEPVTLAHLGPATTAIRSDGAEIRVDAGRGRWARIRGTETAAWLMAYSQGLLSSGRE